MPQDPTDGRPPWAPTEAPLSLTLGSPSGPPGLARGPLGRLREVIQGSGEAREGRPCAEVRPVHSARTRVNRLTATGDTASAVRSSSRLQAAPPGCLMHVLTFFVGGDAGAAAGASANTTDRPRFGGSLGRIMFVVPGTLALVVSLAEAGGMDAKRISLA